jgi:hypothetical protein
MAAMIGLSGLVHVFRAFVPSDRRASQAAT